MTSQFRTRSRPSHQGADLFYRWQPSDGVVRVGDGGAARDRKTGKPKWFIPTDTRAVAAAAGVVVRASFSPTGHIVWLDHRCGWWTGYMHLRELRVKRGDVVALGAELGVVGDNPAGYDATHLHFETATSLRDHPTSCRDPEAWLRGARVLWAS